MKILSNSHELCKFVEKKKLENKKIGFVPTMGALHEGHGSLLQRARGENDTTVLSIFVNPTQFGPNEDLSKYPKTTESDIELANRSGVDCLFIPSVEEIYPEGFSAYIRVTGLSEILCGKFRPGHFDGVATVVYRLFSLVSPHRAYFGRKDLQQFLVLKQMVRDLNLPLELISCPTVRESSGLAMSSRNRYLSETEHSKALMIPRVLKEAESLATKGVKVGAEILEKLNSLFQEVPDFKLQYIEIRSLPSLMSLEVLDQPCALFLAGFIGTTRLIDNQILIGEKELDSLS